MYHICRQSYFSRIFDLTAFPGKNDMLYHPEPKGPENGLKTAIPGKKGNTAAFHNATAQMYKRYNQIIISSTAKIRKTRDISLNVFPHEPARRLSFPRQYGKDMRTEQVAGVLYSVVFGNQNSIPGILSNRF